MTTNENSVLTAAGSRRRFLVRGTTATLSATAVALMMGRESLAASNQALNSENVGSDVAIMNVALTLEWEAIGAYQIGAESGLLSGGVLDTAVLFQSQHKEHAEALRSTIIKLGGTRSRRSPRTIMSSRSMSRRSPTTWTFLSSPRGWRRVPPTRI